VSDAAAGWLAAAAAGTVTALLAARNLGPPRGLAAWTAAAARGVAVSLAVVAAWGPVTRALVRVPGSVMVAAPHDAELPPADAVFVRWPDDGSGTAPDAAAALETLRALRDAARPAALTLVARDGLGRGRETAPTAEALRPSAGVTPYVQPIARGPAAPGPGPAPRIVAPAGAVDGVPVTIAIDAGDTPFDGEGATLEIEGRTFPVPTQAGSHRASSAPIPLAAGSHVVVADVRGRREAAALVEVAGPPRVLVVEPPPGAVAAMLRAQGVDVAAVAPGDVRTEDVDRCAAIVLGPGVAGDSLTAAVAARVRSGAGLLALGGEKRAGLSRLRGTALDPLLPVAVPAPPPPDEPPAEPPPTKRPDPQKPKAAIDEGEKEALRVALLLVIDTSGSMSYGGKLQLAQAAAIAAARALAPEDRVSVMAFADQAIPVAPFQDAVDLEQFYRRIAALRPGGGTNFHPALRLGFSKILEEKCGIRHVVLLTDGETQDAVFQPIVEGAVAKGITLSTVAIGDDADTKLLLKLANWGRGKWYLATDPARLPEVVTLDTRRFATEPRDLKRAQLKKPDAEDLPQPPSDAPPQPKPGPSEPRADTPVARRPHAVAPAAFLAGLEDANWPALPFPETTTPRAASQVVLAWDDGAPALALGRAGLGRVAVVAAGASSPEARDFLRWPEAPRVLAQLVRSLVEPPGAGAEPVALTIEEADDGRAFARAQAPGGGVLTIEPLQQGAPITARCADRGDTSLAELSSMPPRGVYAGTFSVEGGAIRRVVAVSDGPREPDPALVRAVVAASGATAVGGLPSAPDGAPDERETPDDARWLVAAAASLVAEAALRRLARRTA
jgi:uncharacterized protein YegL